ERLAEFREGEALVRQVFEEELAEPVPDWLVSEIGGAQPVAAADDTAGEPRPETPADKILSIGTPVPGALPHQPYKRKSPQSIFGLAASLLLAAALGAGTMWYALPRPAPPGWIDQVAEYHRLYAREGRHRVEVRADELDHIVEWLGGRVGGIDVPDFSALGFEFEGARLLAAAGAPVAQLVFVDGDDRMVALCVTPRSGAEDTLAERRQLDDLEAITWNRPDQAVVLIGPTGTPGLPEAARLAGALDV
ncbi:MAG: hypothetical protein AAGL66_12180, partial [Pseudomonadota bacterium]